MNEHPYDEFRVHRHLLEKLAEENLDGEEGWCHWCSGQAGEHDEDCPTNQVLELLGRPRLLRPPPPTAEELADRARRRLEETAEAFYRYGYWPQDYSEIIYRLSLPRESSIENIFEAQKALNKYQHRKLEAYEEVLHESLVGENKPPALISVSHAVGANAAELTYADFEQLWRRLTEGEPEE